MSKNFDTEFSQTTWTVRTNFELCFSNDYRQLLNDCGIGIAEQSDVVNQHRVLLFFQLKSMLDIVENDLLK